MAPRSLSSLFSMACMSNTNGLLLTAKEITFCQGLGTGRGRNTDQPDQGQCISNRARHEETKQQKHSDARHESNTNRGEKKSSLAEYLFFKDVSTYLYALDTLLV